MRPFAYVVFDGVRLSADPHAPGRRLRIDARCLHGDAPAPGQVPASEREPASGQKPAGEPVTGAFAHVCALTDREAALPYDEPEVQQARRDALAWWVPLLGESFVCMSTFALDASRCAGAITVARDPRNFDSDPFGRLFAGTVVETDLFHQVPPPPGPAIERYSGAPWPGGRFS